MKSILAEGYGIIPKLVMRDESLSIEAKAIYAYLAAFAGNRFEAYPSVELICHELNISKKRFLTHRKMLVERGYMEIKRQRAANGFSNNVYVLTQSICYGNDSLPHETVGQQGVTEQYVAEQDVAAISNRFTNNNFTNNSLKIKELAAFYTELTGEAAPPELAGLVETYKDVAVITEALSQAHTKGRPVLFYADYLLKNSLLSTSFGGVKIPF